jgi:hypothetical protein
MRLAASAHIPPAGVDVSAGGEKVGTMSRSTGRIFNESFVTRNSGDIDDLSCSSLNSTCWVEVQLSRFFWLHRWARACYNDTIVCTYPFALSSIRYLRLLEPSAWARGDVPFWHWLQVRKVSMAINPLNASCGGDPMVFDVTYASVLSPFSTHNTQDLLLAKRLENMSLAIHLISY